MPQRVVKAWVLRLLTAALIRRSAACTFFEVRTGLPASEVVVARTMEFGRIFGLTDWLVNVHARGGNMNFSSLSGPSAHTGHIKYGFVGMGTNAHKWPLPNIDFDGMNEKGLTVAAQSQYRAEYQRWDPELRPKEKKLVLSLFFVQWALANFATVQEVQDAVLSGDYVVSNLHLPREVSLHWAIADAQGNSIVLEYERGEPRVYNNTVGVMTNDPFFPWHVENLNTYSWLSPVSNQNKMIEPLGAPTGTILSGQDHVPNNMGHGFNLGGLPGDASPPSRFVRAFYFRQLSLHNSRPLKKTISQWLAVSQAVLNSIFVPMGSTGLDTSSELKTDFTSFATLRVPQTGFYAFRTYANMQWHVIDLKKLDFRHAAKMQMPSDVELALKDVTDELRAGVDGVELSSHEETQAKWPTFL